MKPIADVESTRRAYHADAERDTVHRSSLMAPTLPGASVDVSFVNHFLLKRGHENVACRMTAVGPDGRRIESRTLPVTEPRVYVLPLEDLTDEPVANYLVEFFSPSNLYYPFPAVVVTHRGEGFVNSVHSYNRVLNDVFEDDEINAHHVREASVDVRVSGDVDTFALFTAGPRPCRGTVDVRLESARGILEGAVPVDLPRFGNEIISLRSLFGDEPGHEGAVLTLRQPTQFLFYGRMLAGLRCDSDGAIGANHSFYDCSDLEEYWPDGRPSSRVYPILEGFRARIRLYPIFSACRLLGKIEVRDRRGGVLRTLECPPLQSPSRDVLDLPITDALEPGIAAEAASFRYVAWPEKGATPRRLNHQLVFEDPDGRSPLSASTAISLRNPGYFDPGGGNGLTWGQCAVGDDLESRLGLVLDGPDGGTVRIRLRFFDEGGEVLRREVDLAPGSAWTVDPATLIPERTGRSGDRPRYLWYWAESPRRDLSAYTVVRHRRSGHCSGEHSF